MSSGTDFDKKKELPVDVVNHPSHYNNGDIEVLEFIEDQGAGEHFCKGNELKYSSRTGLKGSEQDEIKDLNKVGFYVKRRIEYRYAKMENRKPRKPNEIYNRSLLLKDLNELQNIMLRLKDSLDASSERDNLYNYVDCMRHINKIKGKSKDLL